MWPVRSLQSMRVGLVVLMVATGCGGDPPAEQTVTSTDPPETTRVEPTPSTAAADETTSTAPAPVPAPDRSGELPQWAITAQFSGFFTAASLRDPCDELFGESPLPSVAFADVFGAFEPIRTAHRGTVIEICLPGFPDGPVEVTIDRPDGRQEKVRRDIGDHPASPFRLIGRSDPLGTWTVRATQGTRQAEAAFEVVESTRPRVTVVPFSMLDLFLIVTSQVPPGEPHLVLFIGFEPNERVQARLYDGYGQQVTYVDDVRIEMDSSGGSLLAIPTNPADRELWRCLALDPAVELRMYPDPTWQAGDNFCQEHPFTTVGATAAIESITCDGLGCDFGDEVRKTWRVAGVEPDDPDGGLNVRSAPRVQSGNVTAVLSWDAVGIPVERTQSGWSAISVHGWVDAAFVEPDLNRSCAPGLIALRVTTPSSSSSLPVGSDSMMSDVIATLKADSTGLCGAEHTYGNGRQVLVSGWVATEFLAENTR